MSETASKWASILSRLTHSKTSIDQAACFALQQPQRASELLAAVVARAQAADTDSQLAALFLFDCICKRASAALSVDANAVSLAPFLNAADGYAVSILQFVLPTNRVLAQDERTRLLDNVRSIIKNWERKALFRSNLLLEARQLLVAAEESLHSEDADAEHIVRIREADSEDLVCESMCGGAHPHSERIPGDDSNSVSFCFSPPRPPPRSAAYGIQMVSSPVVDAVEYPTSQADYVDSYPRANEVRSQRSGQAPLEMDHQHVREVLKKCSDAAVDAAPAFMEAIEANRAVNKRLKIEARLRPRVLSTEEEFETEWQALASPREDEVFAVQAAALPFGNSAKFSPYTVYGEPQSQWLDTNYDALEACLQFPAELSPTAHIPVGREGLAEIISHLPSRECDSQTLPLNAVNSLESEYQQSLWAKRQRNSFQHLPFCNGVHCDIRTGTVSSSISIAEDLIEAFVGTYDAGLTYLKALTGIDEVGIFRELDSHRKLHLRGNQQAVQHAEQVVHEVLGAMCKIGRDRKQHFRWYEVNEEISRRMASAEVPASHVHEVRNVITANLDDAQHMYQDGWNGIDRNASMARSSMQHSCGCGGDYHASLHMPHQPYFHPRYQQSRAFPQAAPSDQTLEPRHSHLSDMLFEPSCSEHRHHKLLSANDVVDWRESELLLGVQPVHCRAREVTSSVACSRSPHLLVAPSTPPGNPDVLPVEREQSKQSDSFFSQHEVDPSPSSAHVSHHQWEQRIDSRRRGRRDTYGSLQRGSPRHHNLRSPQRGKSYSPGSYRHSPSPRLFRPRGIGKGWDRRTVDASKPR